MSNHRAERWLGHRPSNEPDTRLRPDALLAALAAEQWGVVSLSDARRCGLSRRAVASRVHRGLLHPIHRGVYAVGHPAVPDEGRMLAAVLACGLDAALTHFAAVAHWGLADWEEQDIDVTIPGPGPRKHPGIRVHRSKLWTPVDVTVFKGVPVTTPARSLADYATQATRRQLRRAVRTGLSMGRVSVGSLASTLARLGPRRGAANLAEILAVGFTPTRSELEDVVLELIMNGGFVHPDVNAPLRIGRRVVIPDFRWSEQQIVVEADGAAWHDNQLAREEDAERQALLEASGERVLRVTWNQAVVKSAETHRRFEAAGIPRRR